MAWAALCGDNYLYRYIIILSSLLAAACDELCPNSRLSSALSTGRLATLEQAVSVEFPDVCTISCGRLAAMQGAGASPLLLDVRSEAEFAVSRLPGARRIDGERDPLAQLHDVECTQPIVVYCSIGWRSAQFARRLRAAGFLNVANLEGSIFRWALDSRPMVNDFGPVQRVHPFNSRWGKLLPDELRIDAAAQDLPASSSRVADGSSHAVGIAPLD